MEYFVVNLDNVPGKYEEDNDGADTRGATITFLDWEADRTAYNDETIVATEETVQSKLHKKDLDCFKTPEVFVTANDIRLATYVLVQCLCSIQCLVQI